MQHILKLLEIFVATVRAVSWAVTVLSFLIPQERAVVATYSRHTSSVCGCPVPILTKLNATCAAVALYCQAVFCPVNMKSQNVTGTLLTKFTMFNPATIYVLCHLYLHICLALVAILACLARCAQVSRTVDYVGSLCVIEYTVQQLCVLKFLSFWQKFYNCYCVSNFH